MADLQRAVQALLDNLVESGEEVGLLPAGCSLCRGSAGGGLCGEMAITGP